MPDVVTVVIEQPGHGAVTINSLELMALMGYVSRVLQTPPPAGVTVSFPCGSLTLTFTTGV